MRAKQRIKSITNTLFSNLQGLIIKSISVKRSNLVSKNTNKSLVIGPGKEFNQIGQIGDRNYSAFYIPNLNKKRFASGILKQYLNERTGVTLVSAIDEEVLKFKDALWMHEKISNIFVVAFDPINCSDESGSLIRFREFKSLNKYGHPVRYLPFSLGVSFTSSLRNTGLISIHLAASKSDTVECIGFNFYASDNQEGTLEKSYGRDYVPGLRSVSEELWQIFYAVVDFWPDTQFVIYLEEIYPFVQKRKNLKVVILK